MSDIPSESLASQGRLIFRRFDSVVNTIATHTDESLHQFTASFRNHLERFKIWAVDLGLLVPGHGSLDYRVREAEVVESAIARCLRDMSEYLEEARDALKQSKSSETELSLGVEATSIIPDPNQDLSTTDWDLSDEEELDSEAQVRLISDSVADTINQLFRLSTKIRNTSSRLISTKALSLRCVDNESGCDLFETFKHYDYCHVLSIFTDLHGRAPRDVQEWSLGAFDTETDKVTVEQETHADETCLLCKSRQAVADDPGLDSDSVSSDQQSAADEGSLTLLDSLAEVDYLVQRLARANSRRRQQFFYWRAHRAKKEVHTDLALRSVVTEKRRIDLDAGLSSPRQTPDTGPHALRLADLGQAPTVTTATRLLPRTAREFDTRSIVSVSEYAPSNYDPGVGGELYDTPPAPRVPTMQKYFECPYCFTTCSRQVLVDKAWKAHLIHDLRPYVCTYRNCKSPEKVYESRAEWIAHENSSHRKHWHCPHHPETMYSETWDLVKHIEDEHGEEADIMSTEQYLQSCEAVPENSDRPCPVCLFSTEDAGTLAKHIALHLERVSFFALPRSTGHEGEETEGGDSAAAVDADDVLEIDSSPTSSSAFDTHEGWHKELFAAAEEDDHDRLGYILQDALQESENLPSTVAALWRAVNVCVGKGHVDFMKRLLERLEMRQVTTESGVEENRSHALETAALCGRQDILEVLDRWWPLQNEPGIILAAVKSGSVETVKLILDSHIDVRRTIFNTTNRGDNVTTTTLAHASQRGDAQVVEVLTSKGTNPSNDYLDPLAVASEYGYIDVVRLLLNMEIYATQDGRLYHAINRAAGVGHIEVVKIVLEHLTSLQPQLDREQLGNALICAATGGFLHIARLLLQHGADPLFRAVNDKTSLSVAAEGGFLDLVKFLLDNAVFEDSSTRKRNAHLTEALHSAARAGQIFVVELLLSSGADPLEVAADGSTCLAIAAGRGHSAVVEALLNHPLFLSSSPPTRKFHLAEALVSAVERGHEAVVKRLLQAGADPNDRSATGVTALSVTVEHEIRELLIKAGAVYYPPRDPHKVPLEVESFSHDRQQLRLELMCDVKCASHVESVRLSRDSALLVACMAHKAAVYSTQDGSMLATIDIASEDVIYGYRSWETAVFSPENKHVFVARQDGTTAVHEILSGDRIALLEGHKEVIYSIDLNPDGRSLASSSSDLTVVLWELDSYTRVKSQILEASCTCVRFSPDGRMLAVATMDSNIWLLNADTLERICRLVGFLESAWDVSWVSSGAAVYGASLDESVQHWIVPQLDTKIGMEASPVRANRRFEGFKNLALTVACIADAYVAGGSQDHTVRIWDAESGENVCVLKGWLEAVTSIDTSLSGNLLAVGSLDRTISIWRCKFG